MHNDFVGFRPTVQIVSSCDLFRLKLKYRKIHWKIRKSWVLLCGCQNMGRCPERLWHFHPCGNSKWDWSWPWAPCSSWPRSELGGWTRLSPGVPFPPQLFWDSVLHEPFHRLMQNIHRTQENLVIASHTLWWSLRVPVKAVPHAWCWNRGLSCS